MRSWRLALSASWKVELSNSVLFSYDSQMLFRWQKGSVEIQDLSGESPPLWSLQARYLGLMFSEQKASDLLYTAFDRAPCTRQPALEAHVSSVSAT